MMDAEKKAMQRRIDKLDQYATSLHAALTGTEREIARLTAELETVKRERDAAVKDMAVIKFCHLCKNDKYSMDESDICYSCVNKCCWEWRGLCAENGGAEDAKG